MPPELTVYMLPHRHALLSLALYGPSHGSGLRTLDLSMLSGERHIELKVPVLCRYENNVPVLETKNVEKSEWELLCSIVQSEGRVKVIFDDGNKDHLGKLGVPGGEKPRDGGVEMVLRWKEGEGVLGRGVRWLRGKLK